MTEPTTRRWESPRPITLRAALSPFQRGAGDPATRVSPDGTWWRAVRTPEGLATVAVRCPAGSVDVDVRGWGPGAAWALEGVPGWLGGADDDSGFVAHHDAVRQARRRFPHWRVSRSGLVLDALVPAIIEQKVTGQEAFRSYRDLLRRFGDAAPGPAGDRGMRVAPSAAGWAAIPSWEWLRAGVDPARSRTIVTAVRHAGRLEECAELPWARARERLLALPGVGRWTAAEVAQRALGDPDAVSFGDFHVAKDIGWALTGSPVDDDALDALLAPYEGHRYRVQRLLELGGYARPRRGPRMAPRTHLPRGPG